MPVIKKDDVTKPKIAKLLNAAAIETTIDDDETSLYASKGGIDFGVYVKFDQDANRLRLWTYLPCKEGLSADALKSLVSTLNSDYVFVKFTYTSYEDGKSFVNGEYDIYFTFGLISENFIHSIKKFAAVFISAIRDEDKEDIYFS
jgi:hypothetical protein